MYLREYIDSFKGEKIKMYVDMDGVIADYNVGEPRNYDKKRPLFTSINKLEEISKISNVELFILSVTRMTIGIEEKNIWLDKYAPFFKKENRVIISREANNFEESKNLKSTYLKNLQRNGEIIIVIDDDPSVIKQIADDNKDVKILKDTALID